MALFLDSTVKSGSLLSHNKTPLPLSHSHSTDTHPPQFSVKTLSEPKTVGLVRYVASEAPSYQLQAIRDGSDQTMTGKSRMYKSASISSSHSPRQAAAPVESAASLFADRPRSHYVRLLRSVLIQTTDGNGLVP